MPHVNRGAISRANSRLAAIRNLEETPEQMMRAIRKIKSATPDTKPAVTKFNAKLRPAGEVQSDIVLVQTALKFNTAAEIAAAIGEHESIIGRFLTGLPIFQGHRATIRRLAGLASNQAKEARKNRVWSPQRRNAMNKGFSRLHGSNQNM